MESRPFAVQFCVRRWLLCRLHGNGREGVLSCTPGQFDLTGAAILFYRLYFSVIRSVNLYFVQIIVFIAPNGPLYMACLSDQQSNLRRPSAHQIAAAIFQDETSSGTRRSAGQDPIYKCTVRLSTCRVKSLQLKVGYEDALRSA